MLFDISNSREQDKDFQVPYTVALAAFITLLFCAVVFPGVLCYYTCVSSVFDVLYGAVGVLGEESSAGTSRGVLDSSAHPGTLAYVSGMDCSATLLQW